MTLQTDLLPKINNEDYQRLILKHSVEFSEGQRIQRRIRRPDHGLNYQDRKSVV